MAAKKTGEGSPLADCSGCTDQRSESPWRKALLGFGILSAFFLSGNLAVGAHELGHAFGIYSEGGQVTRFVLQPFSDSYVFGQYSNILVVTWWGFLFGTGTGFALLALSDYVAIYGSLVWIVIRLTSAMAIGLNGIYLFVGSLTPYGDALILKHFGVPSATLFLLGLGMLLLFTVLLSGVLIGIGLLPTDGLWLWVLLTEVPLSIYLAANEGRTLLRSLSQHDLAVPVFERSLILVSCALFAAFQAHRSARRKTRKSESVSMKHTFPKTLLLATVTVAVMLAEIVVCPQAPGRGVLHMAVLAGDSEQARRCISSGANVNQVDQDGITPLHIAAQRNAADIATLLLTSGARIDATDGYGNTPLFYAVHAYSGDPGFIQMMRTMGANPRLRNNYDQSPLELAQALGSTNVRECFSDLLFTQMTKSR